MITNAPPPQILLFCSRGTPTRVQAGALPRGSVPVAGSWGPPGSLVWGLEAPAWTLGEAPGTLGALQFLLLWWGLCTPGGLEGRTGSPGKSLGSRADPAGPQVTLLVAWGRCRSSVGPRPSGRSGGGSHRRAELLRWSYTDF